MEEESDFIERGVIQLQREYGKDELVATLNKRLSEKMLKLDN